MPDDTQPKPHWSAKSDAKRKTTGGAYAYRYTLNQGRATDLAWGIIGGGPFVRSDFLDAGMRFYLAANGVDWDEGVGLPGYDGTPPAIARFRAPTKRVQETDLNKIKDRGGKYSYRYTMDNARAIALLDDLVGLTKPDGTRKKISFIDLLDEAMSYYLAREAGVDWNAGTLIPKPPG